MAIQGMHGQGDELQDELGPSRRWRRRRDQLSEVGSAGMAGFIKTVLQVMRCESSPNVHLREMNPHLDVEGAPIFGLFLVAWAGLGS